MLPRTAPLRPVPFTCIRLQRCTLMWYDVLCGVLRISWGPKSAFEHNGIELHRTELNCFMWCVQRCILQHSDPNLSTMYPSRHTRWVSIVYYCIISQCVGNGSKKCRYGTAEQVSQATTENRTELSSKKDYGAASSHS